MNQIKMKPKTDKKTPFSKKVARKQVSIVESNLIKTKLVTKYNKIQLLIAKWIGVEPSDTYEYLYKIRYKGNTTLKTNDIVFNSEHVLFVVVDQSNRLAMLVSTEAFVNKPKMFGVLTILEKPKTESEKSTK